MSSNNDKMNNDVQIVVCFVYSAVFQIKNFQTFIRF
jgi:hypothetical protein